VEEEVDEWFCFWGGWFSFDQPVWVVEVEVAGDDAFTFPPSD